MGKRGPKPREIKPRKWDANLAYCIGLIATDGCLYNDGRHISFVSADIQLVTLFKNLLSLSNRIGYKTSGSSGQKCPHIQFGNVGFYKWLVEIGLTPHKSLTLGPISVPRKYFMDFTRGCFDGDGSIYSYMDSRWANSHMFYISFASASKTFINWLRNKIYNIIGIHGHISTAKKRNFYQLRYAKAESLVLINKMYYNKQVPCLKRKRQRILEIHKVHQQIQSENPRIFLSKGTKIDI